MELKSEQLIALKKVEIDILKAFIKVCDSLKLKYYILEGTLLGAVRHKGFIPWDDDIDVGMPRADYERFCHEGQNLLPDHYFIQTINTEKDYRANFAKIRNSRTTFIETSVRHCNINHGIYIDIFPLDDCFDDEHAHKRRCKSLSFILMTLRVIKGFYVPDKKKTIVRRLAELLSVIRYPTIRGALLAREKWMKALPQSNTYANYCSAWYLREVIPKEWFGDSEYLEFEGLRVRVPKEYDKWLTRVYGNYMQLPPPEKRVAHHYADVIDVNKPYQIYIKSHDNKKDT